ncbi:MAG: hypothetical protein QFB87_04815 [Patescibacteria group bacterium]|nr:hypothetical protein [Patescibacteria group bacterium]
MSITVASWNIDQGFSQRAQVFNYLTHVEHLDADVIVLPEAYGQRILAYMTTVERICSIIGYQLVYADYAKQHAEPGGLMVLSRLDNSLVPSEGRHQGMISGTIVDPDTQVPVHLSAVDLTANRAAVIRTHTAVLAKTVRHQPAAIVAGDFEPGVQEFYDQTLAKTRRFSRAGRRLAPQAVASRLSQAGYQNVDPVQSSRRQAQILAAGPNCRPAQFTLVEARGATINRAIRATFETGF